MHKKFCPNCGKETKEGASFCTYCGTKLNNEESAPKTYAANIDEPKNFSNFTMCEEPQIKPTARNKNIKKNTIIISSLAAVIVAVIIAAIAVFTAHQNNEYLEKAEYATNFMLSSGADAEEAANLTKDVWYNSIHEIDSSKTNRYTKSTSGHFYNDFNVALLKLFSDEQFSSDLKKLKNDKATVESMIKELNNPPKKYEELYGDLVDFYVAYSTLIDLAVDAKGSYKSFTSDFANADKKVLDSYKRMEMYF